MTIRDLAEAGRIAYETTAPVMKRRRDALQAEFSAQEIATFVGLLDRLEDFMRRPIERILEREPAK